MTTHTQTKGNTMITEKMQNDSIIRNSRSAIAKWTEEQDAIGTRIVELKKAWGSTTHPKYIAAAAADNARIAELSKRIDQNFTSIMKAQGTI
jgi:ribosomal 50S subunit-associated protein YjgA (DUF615 family)